MKAIICTKYGSPEVLQIKEVPTPVPQSNEVLIKVAATTVTVADFRIRSFTIPASFWIPARLMFGITKPRKPILGIEFSGEIESVGKDVTLFKKGDLVFASSLKFGGYAEFTCLPETATMAVMPVNSTFEEAAAIPVGAHTALHYLRKGGIKKGQKVLVYGASGSVGSYAVQLARYFGADVTGVCSGANAGLVKSLGAQTVLDYNDINFIKKLEVYDLILIAVDKLPFSICKKVLKPTGVYLNVTPPLKSLSMLWTSMTTRKKIIVGHNPSGGAESLFFLKELVEAGLLKPVIDRCYPFDQMVEAHRYVDKGHKKGNVVITVIPNAL